MRGGDMGKLGTVREHAAPAYTATEGVAGDLAALAKVPFMLIGALMEGVTGVFASGREIDTIRRENDRRAA